MVPSTYIISWSQFDPGKVITPNFIAIGLKYFQQRYVVLIEYATEKSDVMHRKVTVRFERILCLTETS